MATAGSLRDRIVVRRQVNVKNTLGEPVRSWTTIATLWAEVKSLNGRESMFAAVLQGVSTFQVTIRFRADIKVSDQLLWNGRELNVLTAEPFAGKRQWTVIQASTQSPQGA